MAEIGKAAAMLNVQVCHALPDGHFMKDLAVSEGASVEQVIRQSGVLEAIPGIDLGQARVGIYGKLKTLDTLVREGDRIEIYRPLVADPKDARRRRAGRKGAAIPGTGTAGVPPVDPLQGPSR